ncbi:MAG TPA: adenosylmethionine decarboxylase [Vicinamibacteria bacterium]|nr:adenosylmethionine decarboxylase [Vicinamibacteria bacterium]
MNVALGKHLIAELWVRNPRLIDDSDYVRDALAAASRSGDFTVLDLTAHSFAPHGVTAFALLSESHISIHTWPEYGYAAVDIFTCAGSPRKALAELERRLDVEEMEVRELDRGRMGSPSSRPPRSSRDGAMDLSAAV